MTDGPFSIDDQARSIGPLSAGEIWRLVQEGVIQSDQIITTASGNEIRAAEVPADPSSMHQTPPPLTGSPPPLKPSWSPYAIAWLGLVFSPLWSAVMAAINARHLGFDLAVWPPVVIAMAALVVSMGLGLVGLSHHLVLLGLYLGAAWLIWHFSLRTQTEAFQRYAQNNTKKASWFVPLLAGGPLGVIVFIVFMVVPLIPEVPDYIAQNHVGVVLLEQDEFDMALPYFHRSIEMNPKYVEAHINCGTVYLNLGQLDEAIIEFDKAIRLDPTQAVAFSNRGLAWTYQGQFDKAIQDCTEAIRLEPTLAVAYNNRGWAWTYQGQYDEAIKDYSEAIRLDPKDATAYVQRGAAWNAMGEANKAIVDFAEAIRRAPESVDANVNLASCLATCYDAEFRDGERAIEVGKKACELSEWKDVDCIATLAAAYAESGDFGQAIKYQSQAISLLAATEDEELKEVHAGLLKLYQEGKPYHNVKPE